LHSISIGNYLIQQIYNKGVRHVFGVPGDYVLNFYKMLTDSKLVVVNTCDEQGAGFAADAYARLHGLGIVCVTYGVGGLKVVNTTAQAYAEKSPVIVISGAPGIVEQEKNQLLHHRVRNFDTQKKVFDEITISSVVLDKVEDAKEKIDKSILDALRFKRPVYIELPRDIIFKSIVAEGHSATHSSSKSGQQQGQQVQRSNPMTLAEAIDDAITMINSSERPVIIVGVEMHRFDLRKQVINFMNKTNIPAAATILSKSVISELHPLYIGVYAGALGQEVARRYVESSDCLIMLGAMMTDIDLGIFTAKMDPKKTINVSSEGISISYHRYDDVLIDDFIQALNKAKIHPHSEKNTLHSRSSLPPISSPTIGKRITVRYVFERLNSFLTNDMIVLADVGDALFAGTDLFIAGDTEFLSPAYYASLGFAVPASLGAKFARPDLRSIVIVGDGAFQMTGMELSTAIRYNVNPIVIVLNNSGYLTERLLIDGQFNNLQRWQYNNIPMVLGGGRGYLVNTEDQFDDALESAKAYVEEFSIIDVRLDQSDKSPALQRLAEALAERLK
jgi:indolepyruvate decarboxylase